MGESMSKVGASLALFYAPEIIYSAYKLAHNSLCFNDELNYLLFGFRSCRKRWETKAILRYKQIILPAIECCLLSRDSILCTSRTPFSMLL